MRKRLTVLLAGILLFTAATDFAVSAETGNAIPEEIRSRIADPEPAEETAARRGSVRDGTDGKRKDDRYSGKQETILVDCDG